MKIKFFPHSVLSSSIGSNSTTEVISNFTAIISKNNVGNNVSELCGAKFCPGVNAAANSNLVQPHPMKIQLLSGIFLALMIVAFLLVALFTDSLKRYLNVLRLRF